MRNLALTLAYDGTDWSGFQRQSSYPSVQRALEEALSAGLREDIELVAAGRTDAGVHALGQVVSCMTANPMPIERVPGVINRLLPPSISIRRARVVGDDFHARKSAVSRRYWYAIQLTRSPEPIGGRFFWQVPPSLRVESMNEALRPLLGKHDFTSFCRNDPLSENRVRTLQRAIVRRKRGLIICDLQADAFLHQMVRLIVSNLVAIGQGKRPVEWLKELLDSRNRQLSGQSAPASGLYLMRIGYPPDASQAAPDTRLERENEVFSG